VTAYIWALWVEEAYRLQGKGNRLMNRAEGIAREAGHNAVFLHWSISEAPSEIHNWYERRGYEDKVFSVGKNASALMYKIL